MNPRLPGKIAVRNGRVYFVNAYPLPERPVLKARYWLLDCEPGHFVDGADAAADNHIVVSGNGYARRHAGFVGGVDAPAAITEETPIPHPNVRKGTPVRYSDKGYWEKHNARTGCWVPA
jgi:hypothetical protein